VLVVKHLPRRLEDDALALAHTTPGGREAIRNKSWPRRTLRPGTDLAEALKFPLDGLCGFGTHFATTFLKSRLERLEVVGELHLEGAPSFWARRRTRAEDWPGNTVVGGSNSLALRSASTSRTCGICRHVRGGQELDPSSQSKRRLLASKSAWIDEKGVRRAWGGLGGQELGGGRQQVDARPGWRRDRERVGADGEGEWREDGEDGREERGR
jgi:hypothetical protein